MDREQGRSVRARLRIALTALLTGIGIAGLAPAAAAAGPADKASLVADINRGPDEGDISFPTAVRGKLFFFADDGRKGKELWVSDGTRRGTRLVRDINRGPDSSGPFYMASTGKVVIFEASSGRRDQIWRSDGTRKGTFPITSGNPQPPANNRFVRVGKRVYFNRHTAGAGYELWSTNGTRKGTGMVRDLEPGSGGSDALPGAAFGSDLLFSFATAGDAQLGRSNGSAQGTVGLGDPQDAVGIPVTVGGQAYYAGTDGGIRNELYGTDGTDDGTGLIERINLIDAEGSNPQHFTGLGGKAYFFADDGTSGRELWRSDGTAAETTRVKDINGGSGDGVGVSAPVDRPMAAAGGLLYFEAFTPATGMALWRSDGTNGGTTLVKDLSPDTTSPFGPRLFNFTAAGGSVLFTATDQTRGGEPHVSNGTPAGTKVVRDINRGPGGSNPGLFTRVGQTTFFVADDGRRGLELWRAAPRCTDAKLTLRDAKGDQKRAKKAKRKADGKRAKRKANKKLKRAKKAVRKAKKAKRRAC